MEGFREIGRVLMGVYTEGMLNEEEVEIPGPWNY